MPNKVRKIVSGGQTGADRAAWDAAIEAGLETGGFVPAGRLAEDGSIPARYKNLIETETENPVERTRLNVINSDATLILTHGEPAGGTKTTKQLADAAKKPVLHIDLSLIGIDEGSAIASIGILDNNVATLNVAGPRASEDDAIYGDTYMIIRNILQKKGNGVRNIPFPLNSR